MGNALAEIRARLKAAEENKNANFDHKIFPFWNAKTDTTSTVRFLPDGNDTNTFFWVEKLAIKLPFQGVIGGDSKPVKVSVPCVEMFGRDLYPSGCPILSEVRPMYKDESLKTLANTYWKKPVYIYHGFVRSSAVTDDQPPENPIRQFHINKQIHNIIKSGLMRPDMENMPTDFQNGTDFYITKTQDGQYADYGTSSYARKESALTDDELAAIEQYKLSDLSECLGKKPTQIELNVIEEMFHASLDGEQYDPAKWGKYYRPAGLKMEGDKPENKEVKSSDSPITTSAHIVEEKEPDEVKEVEENTSPATEKAKPTAAEILAIIKARGKK